LNAIEPAEIGESAIEKVSGLKVLNLLRSEGQKMYISRELRRRDTAASDPQHLRRLVAGPNLDAATGHVDGVHSRPTVDLQDPLSRNKHAIEFLPDLNALSPSDHGVAKGLIVPFGNGVKRRGSNGNV